MKKTKIEKYKRTGKEEQKILQKKNKNGDCGTIKIYAFIIKIIKFNLKFCPVFYDFEVISLQHC